MVIHLTNYDSRTIYHLGNYHQIQSELNSISCTQLGNLVDRYEIHGDILNMQHILKK